MITKFYKTTCFATAGIMLMGASFASQASEPTLPAGWSKQETATGTQYTNADRTALVLDGTSMAENPTVMMAAKVLDRPGGCVGLTAQPVQKTSRGVDKIAVTTDSVRCEVYLDTSASPPQLLLAIDQADGSALRFGQAIVNSWGRAASTTKPSEKAPVSNQTATTSYRNSELMKAVAATPAANRPIGWTVVTDSFHNGTSLVTSQSVWMLFANGYATECTGWDPRKINPTPTSLSDARYCDTVAWRKVGAQYQLADEDNDGTWDELFDLEKNTRFAAGQKLNFELENWDGSMAVASYGVFTGVGIAYGGVSSGTITASDLSIRPDGSFSIQSKGYQTDGGHVSESEGRIAGSYYVDGHLMAVEVNGVITVRFAAAYTDDMMMFDGKVFSPDRTKNR